MFAKIFLAVVLLVSRSLGDDLLEAFDGPCPSSIVEVIKDFKEYKFMGQWYVIETYEKTAHCVSKQYDWLGRNKFLDTRTIKNLTECSVGMSSTYITRQANAGNEAKYQFFDPVYDRCDYFIVDTDYNNYAVLWTCSEGETQNFQNLLVMSRDWNFDVNSSEMLNATLAKAPFDRSKLKYIEQKDERCRKPLWCPHPSRRPSRSNGSNEKRR